MSNKKLRKQKNHYESLYETCLNELHFEKRQNDFRENIIQEVYNLLVAGIPTNLIKKVIENGKERANIDKLIHSSLIFPNPKKLPKFN